MDRVQELRNRIQSYVCRSISSTRPITPGNVNTHMPASLYEAFEPTEAKRIADKLEIRYTPKHGSRLNMAEIELSVLGRRFP